MEKIMEYLKSAYHPIGMAVYGSFANRTNHLNSDFDALLVREEAGWILFVLDNPRPFLDLRHRTGCIYLS